MVIYAIKILMTDRKKKFFNFLGPGFNSISPWQYRKQKIYKNVNKKIYPLSK